LSRYDKTFRNCDLPEPKNPEIQDPDTHLPVGAKSLVNQRPEPTLWISGLWPSTFVVTILDRSKKSMSKPVTIATIMNLNMCESLLQWASIMTAS
jgi:hypothetical protein